MRLIPEATELDPEPDEVPIDLAGYDIFAALRDVTADEDAAPSANFTVNVTDAPNGAFDLTLTPQETQNFEWERASYDVLFREIATGQISKWIRGFIDLDIAITRPPA